jgi:flagellar hook-length control protein FliK
MSQTNIEYLFQLTGPLAGRALSAPGQGGEVDSLFGDHLSLASATTHSETQKQPLAGAASAADLLPSGGPPSDAAPASASNEQTDGGANGPIASMHDDGQAADIHDQAPAANENDAIHENAESSDEDADLAKRADNDSDDETDSEFADAATAASSQSAEPAAATTPLNIATKLAQAARVTTDESADSELADEVATAGRRAAKVAAADGNAVQSFLDSGAIVSGESADVGVQSLTDGHHGATHPVLSEESNDTKSSRPVKGGKRRAAAVVNAEATGQTAVEQPATEESNANEATSSDPADAKDANEARRGRHARASALSASRAENSQAGSESADAAIVSVVPIQADSANANGEAAQDTSPVAKGAAAKGEAIVATAGRLQPGAVTARRGGRTNGHDDAPRVDAARFVGRVAKAFQTAHERGGTLQLRLSPPELGSLRLELTVKDGVMTAALETESASARRVLLDHLPALRDRLAEQNIRVERFDVDVRRDGSGEQADPRAFHDGQNSRHGEPEQRRRQRILSHVSESARPVAPTASPATNNGINIIA